MVGMESTETKSADTGVKILSQKVNMLVTYCYWDKWMPSFLTENKEDVRWVLDCGAFTAFSKGFEIKLDDYCDFLEKLPVKPWRYFALDVIGNPEATTENFRTMVKRGFNPIPVFTRGHQLDVLDEYYEHSDVVAIGGIASGKAGEHQQYIKWFMGPDGVDGKKVHWFGLTDYPLVLSLKPYMLDSVGWISPIRYGWHPIWIGKGRRWMLISRTQFMEGGADKRKLQRLRRMWGLKASDFVDPLNWKDTGLFCELSISTRLLRMLEFREFGSNLFFAVGSSKKYTLFLLDIYRRRIKGTLDKKIFSQTTSQERRKNCA